MSGLFFFSLFYFSTNAKFVSPFAAGLFYEEKISPENLREKYKNGEIKILIVPGHDNKSYGAQYRGVTESSLNTELGIYLYDYFRNDKKFTIFITNKNTGEINDWLLSYVSEQNSAIENFKTSLKNIFASAIREGKVKKETKVFHNPAADNTSKILYGINKWANENKIDLVLHIHFNDYPGRKYDMPGKYQGFSIYVPESQLPNHRASKEIAESVRNYLLAIEPASNYPKEKEMVIPDQELIAIGSNGSREGASILIEYSYIYEPRIYNKDTRSQTLRQMAIQTFWGVKNYFEKPL
ncbi:N-acetylmuramoyl-L-alanine amidase [Candidatus Giovannonibacteria bacterium]|nr:N-acetylmuramoyl-L-alanine amidase [Candidatus Giovannonibacteria bacterium]